MISTRNIKADIPKQAGKLKQATTKDIDTGVPMPEKPNPQEPVQVSTSNIADVADIAEKQRRDAIMEEKNQQGTEVFYSPIVSFDMKDDRSFNLQYAVVEIDGLLQGISRRELK